METTSDETPTPAISDTGAAPRAALAARLLAETGTLAAESLDYQKTIDQIARLAVPSFADWCIALTGSGDFTLTVAHGQPAEEACGRELFSRSRPRLSGERGLAKVLRTGESDLLEELPDALLVAIAASDDHLAVLRGKGFYSAIAVPMRARGQTVGAMAFVTSTSGRRFAEADLPLAEEIGRRCGLAIDNARLYREAQAAIEAREDMVLMAAHDLRAPITMLSVKAQMLRLKAARSACGDPRFPEIVEGLKCIEEKAQRLSLLLDYFLDLSNVMGGELVLRLEEVDAAAVASECASHLQDELERAGCTLTIHADGSVAGFWDRMRLEQMVNNLLSNALKYGRGKPIDVDIEGDEKSVRFSVRDQGIGIPPDDLKVIFERFRRSRQAEAFPGLGIGLYIVRQIVAALGGTVTVESRPGAGSRFTVELPRRGPEKPRAPLPGPAAPPPPASTGNELPLD